LNKEDLTKILLNLSTEQKKAVLNSWELRARDKQLEPEEDFTTWLISCGRGWGKTLCGAQTVRSYIESGRAKRVALIGATSADVRDVMIQGVSGLMSIAPPEFRPVYEPSKRRLTYPNGSICTAYADAEPEQLRGAEVDLIWCDEICKWKYPEYTLDMARFCLRGGDSPKIIITTTPKPIKVIKDLLEDETCYLTTGNTFENSKLPDAFVDHMKKRYSNTRIGEQELYARLLDDNPQAMWKRHDIEDHRVLKAPDLKRVVVSIDPAGSHNANSDETGITVAGIGFNDQGYVLDDLSLKASPKQWGEVAISAFHKYQADKIVVEKNMGGDMCTHVLSSIDPNIPVKTVHASRGKVARSEPIASLYEQGRIHHVGFFAELEDQMCQWEPSLKGSPDRMDSLCWAMTELMLNGGFEVLIGRA